MPRPVELAYVGLGANLSSPQGSAPDETLTQALIEIGRLPDIRLLRHSSFFRSKPVEASGPDFCNAVAELQSPLEPQQLLAQLLAIENLFGRTRGSRNAPRSLDLDLIAYGQEAQQTPTLSLPHPRAACRAFVLVPLCRLNPTVRLRQGETGPYATAADWLAALTAAELAEVTPW